MKGPGFNPEEIIFAVTDACNLHCPHCFVPRHARKLDLQAGLNFLESIKTAADPQAAEINKIGFSGGEPFLHLDFILGITKWAYASDFMFDRLMTNGVWWKTADECRSALQQVYDAGFDGKIGFSYDSFHGQSAQQAAEFIRQCVDVWNSGDVVEIQSVAASVSLTAAKMQSSSPASSAFPAEASSASAIQSSSPVVSIRQLYIEENRKDLQRFTELAELLHCEVIDETDKHGFGQLFIQNDKLSISVWRTPQSFTCDDKRAWQAKKWFKDDFCEGPGQILYVHPDGKIAPCCGFSNEEPALIIGSLDQTADEVLEQSRSNKMVNLCYNLGLESQIKVMKKLCSGKCDDMCAFCQLVARNISKID